MIYPRLLRKFLLVIFAIVTLCDDSLQAKSERQGLDFPPTLTFKLVTFVKSKDEQSNNQLGGMHSLNNKENLSFDENKKTEDAIQSDPEDDHRRITRQATYPGQSTQVTMATTGGRNNFHGGTYNNPTPVNQYSSYALSNNNQPQQVYNNYNSNIPGYLQYNQPSQSSRNYSGSPAYLQNVNNTQQNFGHQYPSNPLANQYVSNQGSHLYPNLINNHQYPNSTPAPQYPRNPTSGYNQYYSAQPSQTIQYPNNQRPGSHQYSSTQSSLTPQYSNNQRPGYHQYPNNTPGYSPQYPSNQRPGYHQYPDVTQTGQSLQYPSSRPIYSQNPNNTQNIFAQNYPSNLPVNQYPSNQG